ncbi:MAG: PQQ-like beta-propeller repeat protein [Planctomycetes bacterium]|nr:PQQ-like beta-propeller repeat protein [Planctomycetota bacterium]
MAADPGLALVATDGQRSDRTVSGTYEIRHQNGSLVMTKGDVRLMTVPLAAPPTAVYVEGDKLLLREIAMFRGGPVPDEETRAREIVLQSERPASLRWREYLPTGAILKRLPDGRVELATKNTTEMAYVAVPLIRPGLYEVIVLLEDPMPGTGIYLADGEGRPVHGVGFFRDSSTGLPVLGYDDPDVAATAVKVDIETSPVPYAGRRQWLRLVQTGGTLKCWTSGDGVHWRQALAPRRSIASFYREIGLYSRASEGLRSVKLRRLQVRAFDALTSLAPLELRQRALDLPLGDPEQTDAGAWQQWVWENQPEGTDPIAWRRAAAIASLIRGAKSPLAGALLDGLLEEGLSAAVSVEAKVRLLEDATLLYDAWATTDAQRLIAHYHGLSRDLLHGADMPGSGIVCRALMDAPLWTESHRVEPLDPELVGAELLALVCRQEWEEAYRLCRQVRFHSRPPEPKTHWPANSTGFHGLVDWAQARASRRLKEKPPGPAVATPADWQHPLIVDLSSEGYSIHAELTAAVREKAYDTACRILTSATMPRDSGLIADTADAGLFQALPTTIAMLMSRHPRLQQAMASRWGDADQLQLHTAMAENDLAAIRSATVRYHGTPAAAEAHSWLGDRLMAGGRFAPAIGRYQRALPTALSSQHHGLTARIRLAGAMLGWEMGSAAIEPVDFGDVRLTVEEFEKLVAEMLRQHADPSGGSTAYETTRVQQTPPPARFELHPWAELKGQVGLEPEKVPGDSQSLDWPARQMAAVAWADTLIVSNRFKVVAYEKSTGKPKWTYSLGDRQGPAHAWPRVAMRPCLVGGRIYTRLVAEGGRPELVCLDAATGKCLWNGENPAHVVSDPLSSHGDLFALTVDPADGQPATQLVLSAFDPELGTVLRQWPLLQLRGTPGLQHVCRASIAGDKIVVAVAGSLFCCDTSGRVIWARQQTWLPPALDPQRPRRYHLPPLMAGARVYVAEPGSGSVECVDLETGRLHWRAALPGARRLLALTGETLLMETDEGILALSAATGDLRWHHHAPSMLNGYLCGEPGGLLTARYESAGGDQSYPELVWLGVQSGQVTGRAPLPSLAHKQPTLGPLVADDDHLWCFTGVFDEKGVLQGERTIVELKAAGPAHPADKETPAPWAANVDHALLTGAEAVLPGWTILTAVHDEKTGLQSLSADEPAILVTKVDKTSLRLARRVKVPAEGNARLLLEVGHEGETSSTVRIRAGGLPLDQFSLEVPVAEVPVAEVPVAGEPAAETPVAETPVAETPWQRHEIDLSAHAGREVWITIIQQQAGNSPAYVYWKRLEITP